MKKLVSILSLFIILINFGAYAQEKRPDWARWHYLSEEEMYDKTRGVNFVETDPPTGTPRFVAEFEPMQGVMIRYPLGIPTSLVVQLANNCPVYCIVSSGQQNSAQNSFQNAGVNMNNVHFVNAPTDSYWVRDYGPWYIFEDREPAIVDNVYNRPRPNDDNISGVFASYWGIPMYGMNLEHTGGNMMEDGRGHGVSDELVFQENNNNENNVRNKMRDYLGIDPYHVTIDPQGDYIAHVDCWGKYLAPDKILIARLPQSNPRYQYYEQVADYFENTDCCWGYPYTVYRVDEPGGYTVAPYTNSLILNKTVYVPLGDDNTYNQQAIAVYQEAMPGYDIKGISYYGWENTDALHCRTRGVMDFDMLFVDHRDVLHGELDWQESYPVTSKFIAYSDEPLKTDSLLVYYSIDNGPYQVAHMTATGSPDEYVGYITGYESGSEIDYYVFGADESGHRYTQPVFAALEPHHFTVGPHESTGELIITPDTLWFEQMGLSKVFIIDNQTAEPITIQDIIPNPNSFLDVEYPYDFPLTLSAGETVQVTVGFQVLPTKDDYAPFDIRIMTSIGERRVVAMIADSAINDNGLVIVGMPSFVFESPESNPQRGMLLNTNYASQTPIRIISITEEDTDYLDIEPQHDLPYDLDAAEYFSIDMFAHIVTKSYVETTVTVESSAGQKQFEVAINGDLLNVTDISTATRLYPNPTTGNFTVEGANVSKVEVFNLVGQKVHEAEGNVINIDASQWNKGLYLVAITEKNGKAKVEKLIVK